MSEEFWISPDNKIKKQILTNGIWGLKPTENCQCTIKITSYNSLDLERYSGVSEFIVGNSVNNFERLLDNCVMNMDTGEVDLVNFNIGIEQCYWFTLELVKFISNGLIYNWNAWQKYDLALKHKEKGKELYNASKYVDASHRFGKGLKLLCSIPIEVDESPEQVDGIDVAKILDLKVILYNNLASCYLKMSRYETVLKLCEKILIKEQDNVKALYKEGVASCETQDFERSQRSFMHLLRLEPENKVALEKLKYVNTKIVEGNVRLNTIIKKMFAK